MQDSNELSGTIPTEIGVLSQLTWLDLCEFSCIHGLVVLSCTLSDLRHWHALFTLCPLHSIQAFNHLSGTIPTEIGMLSQLTHLNLGKSSCILELCRRCYIFLSLACRHSSQIKLPMIWLERFHRKFITWILSPFITVSTVDFKAPSTIVWFDSVWLVLIAFLNVAGGNNLDFWICIVLHFQFHEKGSLVFWLKFFNLSDWWSSKISDSLDPIFWPLRCLPADRSDGGRAGREVDEIHIHRERSDAIGRWR